MAECQMPDGPFPSYSSALGLPAGGYPPLLNHHPLNNSNSGKRNRASAFAPSLSEERLSKRARHTISDALGHQLQLEGGTEGSRPEIEEPWHLNDRFVRRFDREELMTTIEIPPLLQGQADFFPLGNDRDCPIHPLFRSLQSLASFLPDLAPALRLATRFLLSKHSLPFFHTLITSPISLLQQESDYYQVPLFHLPPSLYADTGLPPQEHQVTIHALVALAGHIRFTFIPEERIENRWAYTERHNTPKYSNSKHVNLPRPYPHPAELHNPRQNQPSAPLTDLQQLLVNLDFRGTNSLINLSTCFLKLLHPVPSAPLTTSPLPPTTAQRLRAAYFLALTLIHELAHAVYLARVSPPPLPSTTAEYEPFYSTQRRGELGHALETSLFCGGKILSLANDPSFSIGLGWQRWPDTVSTYVRDARTHQPTPLARLVWNPAAPAWNGRGWGRLQPAQTPRWETVYAISDAWIKRQFFREFWEGLEVLGMMQSRAFEVDRLLGSRCLNYDWEERETGEGDGWGNTSSYERGDDEEGVVRIGQPWKGFEMPDDEEDHDWAGT